MAKKATRNDTRTTAAKRPAKPDKPKSVKPRARMTAVAQPRRNLVAASGTNRRSSGRAEEETRQSPRDDHAPESDTESQMVGYRNPMFDPPITVFDSVPNFPSDFDELRTPKSDLAKKIASMAVSADEYIRAMKTQKKGNAQAFRINPYSLDIVPGFNVHTFDDPATASYIWGLSESIERQGVLRALLVHFAGGKILVDAGEHRLRATFVAIELRNAAIEGVPIIFAPLGQSDVDRLYQQRLDNTIRPLTILEEGILAKRIIAKSALSEDEAIKEIARNYGTSVAIVQSYLETAALPEEVQSMIRYGRIGATFARQIFRDTGRDPDRTIAIIEDAKARVGSEADKIMPKHIPAEQLAKARAESGTPRRTRTSSRAKFQNAEGTKPKSLPSPTASKSESKDDEPTTPAPDSQPVVISATEEKVVRAEHIAIARATGSEEDRSALVMTLLQDAEPGRMENGALGLGFADREQFDRLCSLLGKIAVSPPPEEADGESDKIEAASEPEAETEADPVEETPKRRTDQAESDAA